MSNETKPKNRIIKIGSPVPTGHISSVLASLYRKILEAGSVDNARFSAAVDRYIQRTTSERNMHLRSSTRGNLKKELLRERVSWKVFAKGLMVLGFLKFEIAIKLTAPNGDELIFGHAVDMNDPNNVDMDDGDNSDDV